MMQGRFISGVAVLVLALELAACSKSAPPAEDASSEQSSDASANAELAEPEVTNDVDYVEGVAGGVMTSTLTFEAAVVSVDQSKREAVLRGPEGEVTVRVGKEAVNFYQVAPGDRVRVAAVRQLVIAVNEGESAGSDGTAVAAGRAEEGDTPGAAVVATTRITSKITAMDTTARTATLTFQDGSKETYDVRPDVDMTRYQVGQEVVFLMTEALALEVQKL